MLTVSWSRPDPEPDEEATTVSWYREELTEEDNVLGTPYNLTATNISAQSIDLAWSMNTSYNKIKGYRVFYKHNSYEDIKTINGQKPQFRLTGLNPYTQYEIWVKPIGVNEAEQGQSSETIFKTTDTAAPSEPILTNITCYETQKIYIQWKRPTVYYKTIDYYYVYYKSLNDGSYKNHPIQADDDDDARFFLEKDSLTVPNNYCIKICAGTKSKISSEVYKGPFSDEMCLELPKVGCISGPPPDHSSSTGIAGEELSAGIIVGAVAALVFILLSILGFVIWKKYCESAYYYQIQDPPKVIHPVGIPDWEEEPGPEGGQGKVAVEDFPAHVTRLHADSDIGFSREYDEILRYSNKSVNATHEHSSHPDNKHKNRYLNIVAYDHSRVILSQLPGKNKNSDYINANFIDGFQKFQAYIGTQGPLEETYDSFWRMIWDQKVFVIVMITNLIERGRRKCDMYWPKQGSTAYGHIEVTLVKEQIMANYTVRVLRLKHSKLKKKKWLVSERTVEQWHYTAWPDHGTPADTLPVLTFVRKSVAANPEDGGPIVVHCSAGVGRTGTYIGIDAMGKQAATKHEINVFGFLKHIRSQRNHLVQTEEQYVFLHDALVEALSSGNTEISLSTIGDYLHKLNSTVSELDSTILLDKQYNLVVNFVPSEYDHVAAKKPINVSKNRDPAVVPIESARVALRAKPGVEGSDYINASWIQGHDKLKEFIITQHPTPETKDDFWTMLWDHNAQTVVLLTQLNADFQIFWPIKNEEYDLGYFRVKFIEEAVHEGHSTLDFVVSSRYDDYELKVRIIHCNGWPGVQSRPLYKVFNVVNMVQDWHLEYQNGPLVVVDKYGATEAATFCALTTLKKQLDQEESCDPYQVCKLAHNKRPGIWQNKDDYLFIYQILESLTQVDTLSDCFMIINTIVQMEDENEDLIVNGDSGNGICNGNGVMPERRHSSTEGSRSSKGEVRVTVNRRHSLPGDRGSASSGGSSESGAAGVNHGRDVSPESVEVSSENDGDSDDNHDTVVDKNA